MATTLRYYAEWKQPNREKKRFLRIYDFENTAFGWGFLSSNPQKIVIASGGINLDYDGRTDNVFEPIKSSSLSVNLIVENDEQAVLVDAIRETSEFNLGVTYGYVETIEIQGVPTDFYIIEWRGVIAPQSVEVDYGIKPYGLSFKAVDGLQILAEYSYRQPDGDEYTDHATLKKHIGRCLQYLPSLPLWFNSTDEFYRYMPDLYHDNHDTDATAGYDEDVLAHTGCNSGVFLQERERKNVFNNLFLVKRKTMSCLDVLTDIMTTMQMTLTMSRGSWHMYGHMAYIHNSSYWDQYARFASIDNAFPGGSDGVGLFVADDVVHQDSQYDILVGSKEGMLPPAAGVTYRHINGGSTLVFPRAQTHVINTNYASTLNFVGPHGNLGDYFPDQSGPMLGGFPKQDDEVEAPEGTGFRMRGTFRMRVRNPFNQLLGQAYDPVSKFDEMIGAKIICSMQIRVGSYYLRQTISQTTDSDFTDEADWGEILINAGAAGTNSSSNRQYYPISHGDAEWVTDSAAKFEFMVLHPEFTSPVVETIEYDDEDGIVTTYPVGLFLKREEETVNKCRYSNASYQEWIGEGPNPLFVDLIDLVGAQNNQTNPIVETFIDLQLPALPGAAGDQTGITIDCSVKGYTAEGFILYDTAVSDWPTPSTNYSWLGNVLIGAPAWKDFEFYIGDASRDQDTVFSAEDDDPTGTEDLELGSSVLGSRYPGALGPMGYLHVGIYDEDSSDWLPNGTYASGWNSLHLPQDPDKGILQVCANVGMNYYGEAREQYSLLLKPRPGTTIDNVITPHTILDFSRESMRLLILTVSNDLETGEVALTGVKIEHDPRTITEADTKRNVGLVSGGGMAPSPGGVVRSHRVLNEGRFLGRTLKPEQVSKLDFINLNATSTGVDTITGFAGGGSGLTQEQIDKLLAITINASGDITDFTVAATGTPISSDEVEDAGNTNKFATQSELNSIASNSASVTDILTVFKESTTGDGAGVYVNTSATDESHVSVTSTTGKLQAGARTALELSETSPGSMNFNVQAGATGSEAQVTALRITGSSASNAKATVNIQSGECRFTDTPVQFNSGSGVTFLATTQGISHEDLDDIPPNFTGIGLDGNSTGIFVGTGTIAFKAGDLIAHTGQTSPGLWACNTAFTFQQQSTETSATQNWLTVLNNFDLLAAAGGITLDQLEPSPSNTVYSETIQSFSITASQTIALGGSVILLSGGVTQLGNFSSTGNVQGANLTTAGTLTASGLAYPTSDGTNGQVITTDGSGALSFTTVSGGGTSYHNRYNTEAETQRNAATADVEFYYTARPDGDGTAENETSDTGVTDTINRTLYYATKFDANPNTTADWTEYTAQPADNATYATAKAAILAGLSVTDATAETRGTLPLSLKMVRTTTAAVANRFLNDFPNSAAAYSTRLLDKDYTGNCMLVRRSNDNATAAIGFDSSGNLSAAAMAAHCGTAGGYCVTLYDQSGNGKHLTQSIASAQPYIYNGTAIVQDNNRAALQFSGSQGLNCSTNTRTAQGACTVIMVRNVPKQSGFQQCFGFYRVQRQVIERTGQSTYDDIAISTAWANGEYLRFPSANVTTQLLHISTWDGTTQASGFDRVRLYENGGSSEPFIVGTGGFGVPVSGDNSIGWRDDTSSQGCTGYIQEVIIYHTDESSEATSMAADINSHFNIY